MTTIKLTLFGILVSAMAATTELSAQVQLSQQAIASAGGFGSAGGFSLQSTIAEMSAITTLQAGGYILTQGFQQDYNTDVSVYELRQPSVDLLIYPNPSNGQIVVQISDFRSPVNASLCDVSGRTVHTMLLYANTTQIDLSMLAGGSYLLQVFLPDSWGHAQCLTTPILIQK